VIEISGLNIKKADVKMAKNVKKNLEYYEKLPYNIIVEQWDDGEGPYWVARVAELPHCLIHGDTPEEAVKEIEEVKRDWIKSNLERGLKIPKPVSHKYGGQISLRIPPSLHRSLSDRAAVEKVSLNQLMTTVLARSVDFPLEAVKPGGRGKGKP
jgi:predicted RNase H-like HicB family nuclease